MNGESGRALDDALRALRPQDVPAAQAARTRDRCLAALARNTRRRDPWARWPGAGRLLPAGTVCLAIAYLAAATQAATALLRLH
jgi:hypothetical protein